MSTRSIRFLRRSVSRLKDAAHLLARGNRARQRILERSVYGPHTSQDVAAALLGEDLWFPPLRDYYVYLKATRTDRPQLWNFSRQDLDRALDVRWCSLPFSARLLRARLGPLTTTCAFSDTPSLVGLQGRLFTVALRELRRAGLCSRLREHAYTASAIATRQRIDEDLHLIEIIAHWLQMLRHADSVARDSRPTGYEVGGYEGACSQCRSAWGIRPRAPHWIPPFHPGCRCFAQPRFAGLASSPNTRR